MKALTTLLLCAALPAQGVFLPFGTGCTFDNIQLAIGSVGTPTIGTTFGVTYTGPNYTFTSSQQIAFPHLVVGFNLQQFVIPQAWPMQPAGCIGQITPDVVFPMLPDPNRPGMFESVMNFAIPNNPQLLGMILHTQWLTIHEQCGFAGCNPDAYVVSDAATVVIG